MFKMALEGHRRAIDRAESSESALREQLREVREALQHAAEHLEYSARIPTGETLRDSELERERASTFAIVRAALSSKPKDTPTLSQFDEWRKWFKDSGNAEFWNKVECIECELGRDCEKHPKAGGR